MKKKIIAAIIIITTALVLNPRYELKEYNFYKYSIGNIHNFDDDLQLVGLQASGSEKKYDFLFYRYLVKKNINKIYFSIQGKDKPLDQNMNFYIKNITLNSKNQTLYSSSPNFNFSNLWFFKLKNNKAPDHIGPEHGKITNPITREVLGYTQADSKDKGSFYYTFNFEKELKDSDNFIIEIIYTYKSDEEKKLIINGSYLNTLRETSTGWEREMARR